MKAREGNNDCIITARARITPLRHWNDCITVVMGWEVMVVVGGNGRREKERRSNLVDRIYNRVRKRSKKIS